MKHFSAILLIAFLASCNQKPDTDLVIIDPKEFINNDLKLSDYVDDIKYIKFSPEIIFGRINHLEASEDFLFLGTDQGLLTFDHDGNFIRKIGSIGNGPEEYEHCIDFTIDDIQKKIFLRNTPYIKIYSFDGGYLKSIRVNSENIKTIYNENSLCLIPLMLASKYDTKCFWEIIDLEGNNIAYKENSSIKFEGEGFNYMANYGYKNSEFIGYWNQYSDTIFRIKGNNISTGFVWAEGNYRLTPSKNMKEEDNNCIIPRTVFETKNLLYIQYRKGKNKYICLYNKDGRKFINSQISETYKDGINNDIDGGMPFNPRYLACFSGNEYFLEEVYPEQLIEYEPLKNKDILHGLSPDDNQVLVIARLIK